MCVRQQVRPLDDRPTATECPLTDLASVEGARPVSTAMSQDLTKRVCRERLHLIIQPRRAVN